MKNLSLILNIVLFVFVIILYVDRFGGSTKKEAAATGEKSGGQIVFVNTDSLLNGYDMYNDLKTQLMGKQKELEGDLTSKSKAFERKAMEFQNKAEKRLITSSQAEQMQKGLQQEQQGLMQLKDQLSMELAQDEQNMHRRLYDSISNFIKEINKTSTYKLVISNSLGGVLLYGDKGLDITNDVMKGLNKRYKVSGNKKEETKK